MAKTEIRKKIEIYVDQPLLRRLRDFAESQGVTVYTVLPTLGGAGEKGRWHDDQVTGGSKVMFVTVVPAAMAKTFLVAVEPLVEQYGLFIATTNVEIMV